MHVGNAVQHTSKPEVDCFSLLIMSLQKIVQSQCFAPNMMLVSKNLFMHKLSCQNYVDNATWNIEAIYMYMKDNHVIYYLSNLSPNKEVIFFHSRQCQGRVS